MCALCASLWLLRTGGKWRPPISDRALFKPSVVELLGPTGQRTIATCSGSGHVGARTVRSSLAGILTGSENGTM